MTQEEFDNKVFDGEKQFVIGCYCGHPCKFLVSTLFISVDQNKETWTDEVYMMFILSEGEHWWATRIWIRLKLMWMALRHGKITGSDITIRMSDAHKLADFIKKFQPVLENSERIDREIV